MTTTQYYVDVHYINLWVEESHKVSLTQLQEMHQVVNLILNKENTDDLAKVPNSGRAMFGSNIGNIGLRLLPIDSSKVRMQQMKISRTIDTGDIGFYSGLGLELDDNSIYTVFIVPFGVDMDVYMILNSKSIAISYDTVGGPTTPGTHTLYNHGKTLAKAILRNISLSDPVTNLSCTSHIDSFKGMGKRMNGNTSAYLQQVLGVWKIVDDNASLDRNAGRTVKSIRSCTYEYDDTSWVQENITNIMDTTADQYRFMVTTEQATTAQQTMGYSSNLYQTDSSKISYSELISGDYQIIVEVEGTDPGDPNDPNPSDPEEPTESEENEQEFIDKYTPEIITGSLCLVTSILIIKFLPNFLRNKF